MRTRFRADLEIYGGLCDALMAVYWSTHQVHTFLRSSDGQNLSSDNSFILARWSEQCERFFSANRDVPNTTIHRIPQLLLKQELNKHTNLHEVTEATAHHQCRKAAGVDGVPPEINQSSLSSDQDEQIMNKYEIWKFGGQMLNDNL